MSELLLMLYNYLDPKYSDGQIKIFLYSTHIYGWLGRVLLTELSNSSVVIGRHTEQQYQEIHQFFNHA